MKPTLRLDRMIDLSGRVSDWCAYVIEDSTPDSPFLTGYGATPLDAVSQLAVNQAGILIEYQKKK